MIHFVDLVQEVEYKKKGGRLGQEEGRNVRRNHDRTDVKYEVKKSASWYMDDMPDNYSTRASNSY